MENENNQTTNTDEKWEYEQIYKHFHAAEQNSHTWMNYYSLFNGALLVAYCTIVVSTGYIVELSTQSASGVGEKSFWLNCTYWHLLVLIAILGVVASYCWYLSTIGHHYWTNNWRAILQEKESFEKELADKDVKKEWLLCSNESIQHYHSTYRVTLFFIWTVMYAWIFIALYSYSQSYNCCTFWISFFILAGLIGLEFIIHHILGSDISSNESAESKVSTPLHENTVQVPQASTQKKE